MTVSPPPIYLFATHREAEHAIRTLASAGFNVKHLSLIGTGIESEEHPMRVHTVADKIRAWGGTGAFWGGVWGLLLAPAVFLLPGLGPVAMAGPMASSMVGAMEGALVVGGASALGAALTATGVERAGIVQFETALKAQKYALIVHGNEEEARQIDLFLAAHRASAATLPANASAFASADPVAGGYLDVV
ncbi:MAG: DUF1269 domain-containing protein [Pseudomonadota bacterium]|nr:DUF1269 domain-containing protein [Pseudomonadota bacterium]